MPMPAPPQPLLLRSLDSPWDFGHWKTSCWAVLVNVYFFTDRVARSFQVFVSTSKRLFFLRLTTRCTYWPISPLDLLSWAMLEPTWSHCLLPGADDAGMCRFVLPTKGRGLAIGFGERWRKRMRESGENYSDNSRLCRVCDGINNHGQGEKYKTKSSR